MSSSRFDVVVVGGGAGGLTAARTAQRSGASTLLVQSGPLGGDCTFTGCVPSKTLLSAAAAGEGWASAMERVHRTVAEVAAAEDDAVLTREGVEVRHGWARFTAPDAIDVDGSPVHADTFVVATGATPMVPPIPGLDEVDHLTSETVFEQASAPASLAILGGGAIGCEMAQAFARLGVAVTLVEGDERLLPKEEADASAVVADALRADGVDVRVGAKVVGVKDAAGGVRLELEGGEGIEAERLLVAVGRRPAGAGFGLEEVGVEVDRRGAVVVDDTMATAVKGIWAIGDVTGRLQLTHAGGRMAMVAVTNATSMLRRIRPQKLDEGRIPWATFTDPEVGRVGLTEAEAADQGARVAELPFTELDRAITSGRTEGFVKLIAGPRRGIGWAGGGRLLGATVVGPTGGDLVHEAALAMRTSMFTGRLAQTVHVYPSWSVAIQLAAAQFFFESQGREARPARA
ncbi:MAG: dihydrolipoyl dehydrogenase family protein [Iamia sp.]